MSQTLMITAANEDAAQILDTLEERGITVLHLPLERYVPVEEPSAIENTFKRLSDFDNIVFGSLLNARFFIDQMKKLDAVKAVRNRVNLTFDEPTSSFLEEQGIPAICTFADGKAINAVEFMLRLRRMGPTLYPCGSHQKEELPGLLKELDIPVEELDLFDLEGPEPEDLEEFREKLAGSNPDAILFHSRRSVNRTLAAYPQLDYSGIRIIAADKGITQYLEKKDISVTDQAEGTWRSMADLL